MRKLYHATPEAEREYKRREQIRAADHARKNNDEARAKRRERAAKKRELNPRSPKPRKPIPQTKICPKCNPPVKKPLAAFPLAPGRRDGHGSYCKECHRIFANSEEQKAKKRERQREKMLDPEYCQSVRTTNNKWRRANPLSQRELTLRRNARKKAATTEYVSYEHILEHILERDGMYCYICESNILPHQKLEFDHVLPLIPLSGEPQGTHSEDNIKPTHRACNRRKANKQFENLTAWDRQGVSP